jgi:hypothetical protein
MFASVACFLVTGNRDNYSLQGTTLRTSSNFYETRLEFRNRRSGDSAKELTTENHRLNFRHLVSRHFGPYSIAFYLPRMPKFVTSKAIDRGPRVTTDRALAIVSVV